RDVLHDASTRPRDRAVGKCGPRPDQKVTDAAIASSPAAVRVRGDDPPYRRLVRVRRIQWKELAGRFERHLQIRHAGAYADRHRESGGDVIDHTRCPLGAEVDVRWSGLA